MNYEAAQRLNQIGREILGICRDELYFSMRFLDVALSSFVYVMDAGVRPFGTDGYYMYFHPGELGGLYRQNRILANRGYLHMVLHCIFRHIWKSGVYVKQDGAEDMPGEDGQGKRYWDLSCDIAVEYIIDGCNLRPVRFSRSLLRRETYRKLELSGHVLNAERICRLLSGWKLTDRELVKLEEEFRVDDHGCWKNNQQKQPPDQKLEQKWKDIDEKMETDLETFSKEAAEKSGDFLDELRVENRERRDYREFLRKFAVFREELQADPDTFDYGFYSYGMSLYGNMPLIEPLETREEHRIEEFVVVIDTSMSCSGDLIRKFLRETYTVLTESGSFFRKVNIHIIQCDEKVHQDVAITSAEELENYMKHFQLYGEGGTDFRPAFEYVEELRQNGAFSDLKGMLYFTDGYGIYPEQMPAWRTAFIFEEDDYRDADVPSWAIKLILKEEDFEYQTCKTGD